MTNKEFTIKLATMLKDSGIKDECLNFMHAHPEMFNDTAIGDNKVMSIDMSVSIVADVDKVPSDPGFITVSLDICHSYSEHFETNHKYWNNKLEEDIVIQK